MRRGSVSVNDSVVFGVVGAVDVVVAVVFEHVVVGTTFCFFFWLIAADFCNFVAFSAEVRFTLGRKLGAVRYLSQSMSDSPVSPSSANGIVCVSVSFVTLGMVLSRPLHSAWLFFFYVTVSLVWELAITITILCSVRVRQISFSGLLEIRSLNYWDCRRLRK